MALKSQNVGKAWLRWEGGTRATEATLKPLMCAAVRVAPGGRSGAGFGQRSLRSGEGGAGCRQDWLLATGRVRTGQGGAPRP